MPYLNDEAFNLESITATRISEIGAAMADVVLNTGDTAWVLASTALVLLMTPGLALFYGGMVRA